jgi:hypothetical protein
VGVVTGLLQQSIFLIATFFAASLCASFADIQSVRSWRRPC